MNQLNIDPTELRGIGIQINKLENRVIKETGRIENFISNMKSEQIQNQISHYQNTDVNNKIKPKIHHISPTVNINNTDVNSTKNCNKLKIVENFFKPKNQITASKSNVSLCSFANIKISQVDPSFLNALPEDLRQELENELKANEYQNLLPAEHGKSTTEVAISEESSRLYQHVNVNQMKEFIEEWITTEIEPKSCDNIMVSEYLCNLIKDTKMEDVYEIIRKLYR